ncbi:MAG: hypothetical protein V3U57_00250 [Robiginitomaculum sp.]
MTTEKNLKLEGRLLANEAILVNILRWMETQNILTPDHLNDALIANKRSYCAEFGLRDATEVATVEKAFSEHVTLMAAKMHSKPA